MRKSLFFVGALFISLCLSAQIYSDAKLNVRHEISASMKSVKVSKLLPNAQLKKEAFSLEQIKAKAMAASAGTDYLAYLTCDVDFNDDVTLATITIDGTSATISGLLPLSNLNDLKGTVSSDGNTISIPAQVILKDAFNKQGGGTLDLCFGSIDKATGNVIPVEFTKDQYGAYSCSNELGFILYAGAPDDFQGWYNWYSAAEIRGMDNLVPYYSTDGIWFYGRSAEAEYIAEVPSAVVSNKTSGVKWESYITNLKDYDYSMTWEYGVNGSYEGDVLNMPINSDLSFPVAIATYNGKQTAFTFSEEATLIAGAGSSRNGVDYGFTNYNMWYGLYVPMNASNEFGYGTGEVQVSQTESGNVENVVLYYPNEGGDLSFKSLDVLLIAAAGLKGSLSVTVNEASLSDKGFPTLGDKIAVSSSVNLSDLLVWDEYMDSKKNTYPYGMLTFSKFTAAEGGAALDKVSVNGSFAVVISGFKNANAGLFMDAVSDYSKVVLSAAENVFMNLDNGYIVRKAYYRNAAAFFRGAVVGDGGTGIASIANEDGIKAYVNGANVEVSYPETVTSVQVVNVAGQVVATYALEGTSATIPAANLVNGLYLLKFDNGATVKVMK